MEEKGFQLKETRILELIAKVVLVSLMVYATFLILKPFIGIVIWAIIIAITTNPIITFLSARFGWSRKKSSLIFSIVVIAFILIPSIGLAIAFGETLSTLMTQFRAGTLQIPPPNPKVAAWPLIGTKIYPIWNEASTNLSTFLIQHKADLYPYVKSAAVALGGGVLTVLSFIASVIIAAFFTSMSVENTRFSKTIARKLAGQHGEGWVDLSVMTIRSVVQGVIGIALIQATIGYIGFVYFEIPLAVVLAFLIMLITIAQLPALLILIFPMIYMFSHASTPEAIAFTIFGIVLGLLDNILKPFLLGRGVDAPMLVILLGAIGGMLVWGILGLFIGSVLLAVAYKLFVAWLEQESHEIMPETNQPDPLL